MVVNSSEARLRIYDSEQGEQHDSQCDQSIQSNTARAVVESSEPPKELSAADEPASSVPEPASSVPEIVFQSQVMRETVKQAKQFAHSSATVLLNGESGTGKELFASLIHHHSTRRDKVFARVNCASLSESLIESELFGHEKGAFTGASDSRTGRFEYASGGTLLLDEISEVPVSIQAKLLRVLEENELQRVGSNTTRRIDVRVIATSNRDLRQEVAANRFRADLYHRLNVLQVIVPPLRNRVEDIPLLAERFLKIYQGESHGSVAGIDPEAIEKMTQHDWPGNVRELRNLMHRACVLAAGGVITAADITLFENNTAQIPQWMLSLSLEEVQRRMILTSLEQNQWNKTRTAEKLGVTARTLSNKLNAYQAQGLVQKAG